MNAVGFAATKYRSRKLVISEAGRLCRSISIGLLLSKFRRGPCFRNRIQPPHMRGSFRGIARETYSPREASFVSPSQTFLSSTKHYEVYAVSVYDTVVFVQVLDDLDTPVFLPRVLFNVVESTIPDDWICNVFPEG